MRRGFPGVQRKCEGGLVQKRDADRFSDGSGAREARPRRTKWSERARRAGENHPLRGIRAHKSVPISTATLHKAKKCASSQKDREKQQAKDQLLARQRSLCTEHSSFSGSEPGSESKFEKIPIRHPIQLEEPNSSHERRCHPLGEQKNKDSKHQSSLERGIGPGGGGSVAGHP
jgi:hypothetical protein